MIWSCPTCLANEQTCPDLSAGQLADNCLVRTLSGGRLEIIRVCLPGGFAGKKEEPPRPCDSRLLAGPLTVNVKACADFSAIR